MKIYTQAIEKKTKNMPNTKKTTGFALHSAISRSMVKDPNFAYQVLDAIVTVSIVNRDEIHLHEQVKPVSFPYRVLEHLAVARTEKKWKKICNVIDSFGLRADLYNIAQVLRQPPTVDELHDRLQQQQPMPIALQIEDGVDVEAVPSPPPSPPPPSPRNVDPVLFAYRRQLALTRDLHCKYGLGIGLPADRKPLPDLGLKLAAKIVEFERLIADLEP